MALGLGATQGAAEDEGATKVGSERIAVDALLARSAGRPSAEDLEALRRVSGLDPWRVAERLRIRVDRGAALEFCKFVGVERDALDSYVRSARPTPYDTGADALLVAAESALAGDDVAAAVDAGRALERASGATDAGTVFGIQCRLAIGECLSSDGGSFESTQDWLMAALRAEGIGWSRQAADSLAAILHHAFPRGRLEAARQAVEHLAAQQFRARDVAGMAASKQDAAQIAERLGGSADALEKLEEAVQMWQELGERARALEARSARLIILANSGQVRAAIEEQRELGGMPEFAPGTPGFVRFQLRCANVLWLLGDERGGIAAANDAEAALGVPPNARLLGLICGTRGNLHTAAGRWEQAVAEHRRALDLLTSSHERIGAAQAENGLAMALWAGAGAAEAALALEGNPQRKAELAEARNRRLLEGRVLAERAAKTLGEAHADGALLAAEDTLGRLSAAAGQADAATALFADVKMQARRRGLWALEASAAERLADLHASRGEWRLALEEAEGGADVLGRVGAALPEVDQERAFAFRANVFDTGVRAAVEVGDLNAAHALLEQGRATALLGAMGGRASALRASIDAELSRRLTAATDRKVTAIAAYYRAARTGEVGAGLLWEAYVARQREESLILEDVRRAEDVSGSMLAPPVPVNIPALQSRLADLDATAVGPAGTPPATVFVSFNLQLDWGCALVVTASEKRSVVYSADEMRHVHRALAELTTRLGLVEGRGVAVADAGTSAWAALDVLRDRLLPPLRLGGSSARLVIAPDRELGYVPFGLLLVPGGPVAFVPSASILVRLVEQRLLRGTGVLGLGDPDYEGVRNPDVFALRGGPRLSPLAWTGAEIKSITPDSRTDRRLLGKDATESGFARMLVSLDQPGRPVLHHRWRAVHLACHGLVDAEWPALSALALTPGGGEDGFLSAAEILRLPISTDLVVLSACRTGRGRYVRTEGILSLSRAFMHAGATRVLASLWNVPDDATSFLMQEFHRHWRTRSTGAADALRLAQIATRDHEVEEVVREAGKPETKRKVRPWEDPKYWAAWVLWGLPD